MKKWLLNNGFVLIVTLLNLLLALYATPIIDHADAAVYIDFSQVLLGVETDVNYAHRSPLYSIILAGFSLFFDSPVLFRAVVFFQYGLLAVTTVLLCRLFNRILQGRWLPAIGALLFNLSLASVYFANILMTEILTVFLLVVSIGLTFRAYEGGKVQTYFWLGGVVGLLVLARFNTVPLLLTYLVMIGLVLYLQNQPLRRWAGSLAAFILPLGLLLNGWCLYNLQHNDFYGLFPRVGQGVPRNITVASINEDDKVSEEHQAILDIFLEARQAYYENLPPERKGSLASFDRYNILADLYGGYMIYRYALPGLRAHFELGPSEGEYELSQGLREFYQEIAEQNSGFIMKYRIVSFFSSFRASVAGVLPDRYGNINLNVLPAFVFVLYKLGFLLMSTVTFLAFFVFLWQAARDRRLPDFYQLVLFFIVFSFWGINLVFVTGADANRYKFPADPFVIALFLAYATSVISWLLSGRPSRRQVPKPKNQRQHYSKSPA